MTESFHPGALLGHLYTLDDGSRVRLRLTRTSDAPAIRELLTSQGYDAGALQIARLVHFDPRRRYVLCATGLMGHSERLLAVGAIEVGGTQRPGAIEVGGTQRPAPDLLLVGDEAHADLARLLTRALTGTAQAAARAA